MMVAGKRIAIAEKGKLRPNMLLNTGGTLTK
jgi:hypothetical protein